MKAPSYDNCPHVQVGNATVKVVDCTMCDQRWTDWLKGQPWYMRLDEWQHAHFQGQLWYWLWRPLCNFADWRYRAT